MQTPDIAPTESPPPVEENTPPLSTSVELQPPELAPIAPSEASAIDPRQEAIAQIERATALPPAIRQRLLAAVNAEPAADAGRVSLAAVIDAVAGALPGFLRGNARAAPAAHPSGDAFFSGAAGELSDSEAEALAQQQLQRAGLLRNQRVRPSE